ncbi:biogenesis of lysosome-related organelles complex 1 subunit 1 [Cucumis melo var. makuwa]|uniref:Biogenesis of lysosome-related organelles complex 1 subunit 1 n=1 Tax=Cucumis melo var. makuwa TaxID=1194695 RepID=A0A5A7V238_CUCMM|nr:biogenesis of lysosome-related organelles complex 1 subunit 1 [Cucumis melo var. makuwa]TYK07598.1 biogenesis of lysosome-related organelles complex 1 subunit 1 [Cucumis melo var. makuwa]
MKSSLGQSRPDLPVPPNRGKFQSDTERLSADVGGLEVSLLQMVSDHQYASLKLRENSEKAKKDAIQKAVRVSDLLVDTVNGGVQESFVNQKLIELEIRALATTIARFTKQTDQWLAATHALNTAVKHFGRIKAGLILLLTEEFSIVIGVHQFNDVEMVLELEGLYWGAVDNGYDTT